MAETRETVQALNAWLDQGHGTPPIDGAQDYAALCRQANQRLQRCKRYLDKQLLGEAIADAESPPDLLEQVGLLSIPRRPEWDAACSQSGIDVAPPLLTDIAVELNAAYGELEPLKPVLKLQRKLLLQAPTTPQQRIDVMRDLARRSRSQTWTAVLTDLQRGVALDLVRQAEAAAARDDLDALDALSSQLERLDDSPARRKASGQVDARRLDAVGIRLAAAYKHRDLDDARRLRDRYLRNLANGAGPTANPTVGEAIAWLADLDRQEADREAEQSRIEADEHEYRTRCERLSAALDDEESSDELERLAERVDKLGRTPPDELSLRFREAMDAHARAARMRLGIRIGSMVAIVAVVATAATFVVLRMRTTNAVTEWSATIAKALDAKQVERALQLLGELERQAPAVFADERMRPLRDKVASASAAETLRAQRFEQACGQAESRIEAGDLDQATTQVREAAAAATRKLAAESARISALTDRINGHRADRKRQLETELTDLDRRVTVVRTDQGPISARVAEIEAIHTQATALSNDVRYEPNDREGIAPFVERVVAVRTEIGEQRRALELLDAIAQAASSPRGLASALTAFADELPKHRHATPFRLAAGDVSSWEAAAAWATVAPTLAANETGECAQAIAKHLASHPTSPNALVLKRFAAWVASADFTIKRLRQSDGLGGVLKPWYMRDLSYVEDKRGTHYHMRLASQYAKVRGKIEVTFQVSKSDQNLTDKLTCQPDDLIWEAARPAPARRLTDALEKYLSAAPDDDWELAYWDLANIVLAEPDAHGALQVTLIRAIADLACRHALGLQNEFARLYTDLASVEADANWVKPSTATDRARLRGNLSKLPLGLTGNPEAAAKTRPKRLDEVRKARLALFQEAATSHRQVAVLVALQAGRHVSVPPQPEGTVLYAALTVDSQPQMVLLGRTGANGQVDLDSGVGPLLARSRSHVAALFVRNEPGGGR